MNITNCSATLTCLLLSNTILKIGTTTSGDDVTNQETETIPSGVKPMATSEYMNQKNRTYVNNRTYKTI